MYEPVSEEMKSMKGPDERIHWFGRPNRKCFILECIFNPMLPFAIVWSAFDGFMLFGIGFAKTGGNFKQLAFVCAFFLFHLMPVWIYLGGVLFSLRKYRNTEYMVTDRGVYVSGGAGSKRIMVRPLDEIYGLSVRQGFFGRRIGVGNVIFSDAAAGRAVRANAFGDIVGIPDYKEVFRLINQLKADASSEI